MSDKGRGDSGDLPTGDSIAGPLADLLNSASQLLGSAPPWVADALAVTVRLTDEPSEAMIVWRHCEQLAERRGLRASAVLRGQSLNLRFRRPEPCPPSRPGPSQGRGEPG